MAIAKRPIGGRDLGNTSNETAVEKFIGGAGQGHEKPAEPKEKAHKKVGVMVYFDGDLLKKIDARAARIGLSRSSWLQVVVIESLEQPEKKDRMW